MALITKVSSFNGELNKKFLNDGTKIASANLSSGTYVVNDYPSVRNLIEDFPLLKSNEAYILGIPKSGVAQGLIGLAKNQLTEQQGLTTRTKADTIFTAEHYLC